MSDFEGKGIKLGNARYGTVSNAADLTQSIVEKAKKQLIQKNYFEGAPKDMAVERAIDGADLTPAEVKFLDKNYSKVAKEVSKLF